MNKKLIYALLLMALIVIILILNGGKTTIDIGFANPKMLKSMAFLLFTALGVAIGLLLK